MDDNDRDMQIAEALCERFEWDGRSFREGEYVAVLDGPVVAVTGNPDDAIEVLRTTNPNPERGVVVQVTHPSVDIIRVLR